MRWHAFFNGYLEVALWGEHPERVINMAMSRGLQLWDICRAGEGRYLLKVRLGGFKAMRSMARRSRCRLKIVGKRGLPFFFMRVKRRKVLAAGFLLFCVGLYILSSFVWFIEITGNKKVKTERIRQSITSRGVRIGMPKSVFDREKIKDGLLADIPELAWAGIRIEGTRVIIEVAEKTLIPGEDENKPADLVARRDGKIEELLILTGTSLVKEGDVVNKGQVLILGITYPKIQVNQDGRVTPAGESQKVRARGLVRARVRHTAVGECPVREERYRDTGAEVTAVNLRYRGREIKIKGPREIPFERYRMIRRVETIAAGRIPGGPVELITITYLEQKHEVCEWGIEGAYLEAVRRARKGVLEELPPDCRIISETHEPVNTGEAGLVRARLTMETMEDIGAYR
ncbi:MAG: sporulation protein YqfD [Peptococcaceae bacterium]|jgi:similar to stage IV sporulation protein|nr:sporulation protein YqfD [Peptococcaceae bacterium]MDH7524539.1 sporulation protein YqfD [Peptococcaceae bacterium]